MPRDGLTVMLVTPNLDIGGAQETARTLAKYLPRAGCRTIVCTFRDGPLRSDIERLGVPVEILPARRHDVLALPWFLVEMVRLRRTMLRLVEEHGVDVVQVQTLGTPAFLTMTLRVRGRVQVWWRVPNIIFLVREDTVGPHRWLLGAKRAAHRWLYRNGARLVDGVIAVSDEVAHAFCRTVGYHGDGVEVVANGVDVERYPAAADRGEIRSRLGFGPDDHLMTMVGTFKRQKGHRFLVEATASIVARFPALHVLLVGDGDLKDEIGAQVQEIGLSGRIHFLGSRRDVADLLLASDSFVLPSLWEGFSVALIEAMASRLPVIATAVSGTTQVMIDGATGWLVPPADADALAAAMIQLLSDRDRAAAVAATAHDRVAASFGAGAQAERLAALFGRKLPSGRVTSDREPLSRLTEEPRPEVAGGS
jgi:glycosyltransferase involved in cell wall biosynthesis